MRTTIVRATATRAAPVRADAARAAATGAVKVFRGAVSWINHLTRVTENGCMSNFWGGQVCGQKFAQY